MVTFVEFKLKTLAFAVKFDWYQSSTSKSHHGSGGDSIPPPATPP